MKRMGWVLGWAVPEAWFAALVNEFFSDAEHVCVRAAPHALAQLEAAGPFDGLTGYSLGALLLLKEPERVSRLGRVGLLAPIFAFAREEQAGGRVARAQVRYLTRWLRRDPAAAVADFFVRAGLDVPPGMKLDSPPDELAWGLERLTDDRVALALPPDWGAWCGADDGLLDAAEINAAVPAVRVVPGGTHHPRALLRAMAEAVV